MKESSYHDAKMEAYYQEVRRLEDRFDGLKLNHILRRLNEAADMITKAASGQEPVPAGVFSSVNTNPRYAMRGRNKPTMAHLVRPQGPIR